LPSVLYTDQQELTNIKDKILAELVNPPKSLRPVLEEIAFSVDLETGESAPDLKWVIEYFVHTDKCYYNNAVGSTARKSAKKAHRRRRLIDRAVTELHEEGAILIRGHIVHPNFRPPRGPRGETQHPKRRKKFDQRPYHGRPGRDRSRQLQHIA